MQKLKILAEGAKYDVACTSSGSDRKNTPGGVGNSLPAGICHSFSADGRCISLLKVLMSNSCMFDCAYCVNRSSNDVPRATFTPEEIVDLTINFYRRNYIEGLFLSSAVVRNPDHTMEMMIKAVRTLREDYRFNGYIHIKAIPGADRLLIEEAGNLVDRMSVNIELPTNESLKLLAPQKGKHSILTPMNYISSRITENSEERKSFKKATAFVPAGQSTQLIVGATPDRDLKILKLSEGLYKKYRLKRVFYSAYVPVSRHPSLPQNTKPPLLREHRLYQADWLLRFYGFSADELLNEAHQDFNTALDPKSDWALRNLDLFPVEINKADYHTLLRIPGIGVRSAGRLIAARHMSTLDFSDIKKLGVVLKRARYFITCKGRYMDNIRMDEAFIRLNLSADRSRIPLLDAGGYRQLSLFPLLPELPQDAGGRRLAEEMRKLDALQAQLSAWSAPNALPMALRAPVPLDSSGFSELPTREDVYSSLTGEM